MAPFLILSFFYPEEALSGLFGKNAFICAGESEWRGLLNFRYIGGRKSLTLNEVNIYGQSQMGCSSSMPVGWN